MPGLRTVFCSLVVAGPLVAGSAGCDRTPTVQLLDLEGRQVDPLATPDTPVTVFLFVRTDCPISNRYAPEVRRIFKSYDGRATCYLVYADPDQAPEAIRKHLREYEYPFEALRDPTHALVALTGATITPEVAVFDVSKHMRYRGRIDNRYAALGQARAAATTHELEDAIAALLAGDPIATPTTQAVGCIIADLK